MATIAITKGYNDPSGFVSGEVITPAKLNSAQSPAVAISDIVNADIKSDAAVALSKLATGALPTAITVATDNIVDANVTTAKIADANVSPAKLSQPLTLATAQATTSGTSIDLTGIPSWVKRITVMLDGVSLNSTSSILIRLGTSGGIATTGYSSTSQVLNGGVSSSQTNSVAGFIISAQSAGNTLSGSYAITNIAGSTWVASGTFVYENTPEVGAFTAGKSVLSSTLDRIRLTTVNGTDTFDAGSVNIMYEG
jgi:hypothetical protein